MSLSDAPKKEFKEKIEDDSSAKTQTRVWCDGCYDLFHLGHANSLRQAKALGDRLIVGVHKDEDISAHKGPPVFTLQERCRMVQALKWVDEVVEGSPYVTTLDLLNQYKCDFCCHGEDVTMTKEGIDTYQYIKNAGRYQEVQRTLGISTTGLVNRILQKTCVENQTAKNNPQAKSPWTGTSQYLLTTQKILQFNGDNPAPKPTDRIVYVCGAFDLFHVGHVDFLEKARALGDYLIVGLHSDPVISQYMGPNYPIMSLQERLLNVLACKYVSDVVIGAPLVVTEELVQNLKVDLVVHGSTESFQELLDPYEYPRECGKFVVVNSGSDLTTEKIVERVIKDRAKFEMRNARKEEKELNSICHMIEGEKFTMAEN